MKEHDITKFYKVYSIVSFFLVLILTVLTILTSIYDRSKGTITLMISFLCLTSYIAVSSVIMFIMRHK